MGKKITDLKQIQTLCYEVLCDIDDYCKEKHISYFLAGGTCLGAVRHHDFIPWDDDIDIIMPRKDFDWLIQGFHADRSDKYTVGSLETNPNWARPAARIWRNDTKLVHSGWSEMEMGLFVDVFPIDGVPQNPVVRWFFYKKIMFLHLCQNSAFHVSFGEYERARFLKSCLAPVCRRIGARKFAGMIDKSLRRYDFESSKLVGAVSAARYWDRETINREDMMSSVDAPFGDRMFPIPKGYDRYLSNLYGDYMKLPDENQRRAAEHRINWEVELLDE